MYNPTPSSTDIETIINRAHRLRSEMFRDFLRGIFSSKATQKTAAESQTIAVRDTETRQQAVLDMHRDAWIGRRAGGLEKSVKSYSY